MANLEADNRSYQEWFDEKNKRFDHQILRAMKSNSEEKNENFSSKPKLENSRPKGIKVSTIAHMFQTLSQQKVESCLVKSPVSKEAPSLDRVQSPDGYKTERSSSLPAFPNSNCSLSRRGSHLTRFNNAKAMFEKLEKGKSGDSKSPPDSKLRASSVPNSDCGSKVQSTGLQKKSQTSNGSKFLESVKIVDRDSSKVILSNDHFSKVTRDTLKPIWSNSTKKCDKSSENKTMLLKEDKLCQKLNSQNETKSEDVFVNNLSPEKVDTIFNEENQKSASNAVNHDSFVLIDPKPDVVPLSNSYAKKAGDRFTSDEKCDHQDMNSGTVFHTQEILSVSDKKTLICDDTILKDVNSHKHAFFDTDVSLSASDKIESKQDDFSTPEKVANRCMSVESDVAYDNFQSRLNNSKNTLKSSPFKVQVEELNCKTLEKSFSESNLSPVTAADEIKVNHHQSSDNGKNQKF